MGGRTFPIIETFGPTIQGEGPDAGLPCYFVRTGGCDYRCSWCDSMYAVEPEQVREHARKLTAEQVVSEVRALGPPRMVVISGGNPALLELATVVRGLRSYGYRVSVETQGSRFKSWMDFLDRLVVSPKPPSSGMATPGHALETRAFMLAVNARGVIRRTALKVVVFDEADYEWARDLHRQWPGIPMFVSAGTPQHLTDLTTIEQILARFRWLCERAAGDDLMSTVKVLPQLHVLAWGTARGV